MVSSCVAISWCKSSISFFMALDLPVAQSTAARRSSLPFRQPQSKKLCILFSDGRILRQRKRQATAQSKLFRWLTEDIVFPFDFTQKSRDASSPKRFGIFLFLELVLGTTQMGKNTLVEKSYCCPLKLKRTTYYKRLLSATPPWNYSYQIRNPNHRGCGFLHGNLQSANYPKKRS